jgi:co-chaperonin GroES (HSP10)
MHICKDDGLSNELINRFKIPFICAECGGIDFPFMPTTDRIFVWPEPEPEKIGLIELPATYRQFHRSERGLVLAAGPGYYNKRGIFIETELKVGDIVIYDVSTMYTRTATNKNGKEYDIKLMGEQDILAIE